MAFQFIEGFEAEAHDDYVDRRYAARTGSLNAASVAGRRNSSHRAIRHNSLVLETKALVVSVGNTWTVGFGFNKDENLSTSSTEFCGWSLSDGVGEQFSLTIVRQTSLTSEEPYAYIELRQGDRTTGATVLATGIIPIQLKRWYYIECTVVVRTGINGSADVYVDGVADTALSISGVDTAAQGTDGADRLVLSWETDTGNPNVIMDDWYARDDATPTTSGDFVVEAVQPDSADGTYTDWDLAGGATSVGHAFLDGATNGNNATELDRRIITDVLNDMSSAPFDETNFVRENILSVRLSTQAKMDTSGTRGLTPFLRDNTGTPGDASGTAFTVNTTSWSTFDEYFDTNPEKGGAWTAAQLDVMEWGIELTT